MKRVLNHLHYGFLCIAIGTTVLALFTSRYGWSFYLERLSHFQVQYFGVVMLLAVITFFLGNFRSCLIILFCSAILSAQILPWYVPLTYPAHRPSRYRVLVSNVNRGQFDAVPTLSVIKTERPDLALLIEVHRDTAKKIKVLTKTLPYTMQTPAEADFHTMLFSKYPLSAPQIKQFGNSDNKESLVATVRVNGQPLSVIATHPASPTSNRMFTARNTLLTDIAEYIGTQTTPILMLGDLNTTMWSPYYRRFIRQTALKNTRKGFGLNPTWPRITSRFDLPPWTRILFAPFQIPLDHCLVSPTIKVAGMHVGADTGSDHAPIVVNLAIETAVAPEQ